MKIKTYYDIAKAVMFGLIILAMVGAGLKGYAWINMKFAHQEAQNKIELEKARQYKVYDAEGAANLARAHTEIGSLKGKIAELEGIANSKDNALKEALAEIKEKKEKIFNLGETVASLEDNIRKLRVDSTHTYKEGTGDPNEQYFIDIMYPIKDKDGNVEREVPYAWAIFYPNRAADKQWKYGIYQLDYHIRTIQTEQEDGQINTYNEVWFENNKRKMSKGVEVPVQISSSEFTQTLKTDKEFFLWAPHINFNIDFGIGTFDADSPIVPGISVSMSGYGRTKNDLDWKFVELGLSSNGDYTYFKFMPFSYNIGNFVPLVSNTFVGPFVGFSTGGETTFGIGLSIPF
jgi:hypothetical protein